MLCASRSIVVSYREEDIEARLSRSEERLTALESNKTKAAWFDFLREPQAVGFLILLASGFSAMIYAVNCSRTDRLEEQARQEAVAARPSTPDPVLVSCRELCTSMGLRGGVLMEYEGRVDPNGHWSAQDDHPGPARTTP